MTTDKIQAAKKRVQAGTVSNVDLSAIKSQTLQKKVSKLLSADFLSVLHVSTEGYNEPETGSAGVEVHFRGTIKSVVDYGTQVFGLEGLKSLTEWVKEVDIDLPGEVEIELGANEDGNMFLFIMTDAD